MFSLYIHIVLIILILPIAVSASDFQTIMNEAQKQSSKQQYFKALDSLSQARKSAVSREQIVAAENAEGWVLFTQGEYEEAEKKYKKALSNIDHTTPENTKIKITNNLGVLYYTTGKNEEAKDIFTKNSVLGDPVAIKYLELTNERIKTHQVLEYINKGVAYRHEKEFDKAIEEYDKALSIEPENVKALEFKGYALYRQEKYDEAMNNLNKASSLSPNDLNIYINMLKICCVRKDMKTFKKIKQESTELFQKNKVTLEGDTELCRVCGDKEFNIFSVN